MCDTTQHVFICSSLDLTLEIFNKCRLKQQILPLDSQRDFVLLYNRVFPPDSVLACSRSNTEINQKSTKKTEPRRCKSGTEGKTVPSSSPDNVDVSGSGEGRSSSKSRHRPSTSSSPLRQSSPSHLHSSMQTVRNKNLRPRVELKLSKCTLHHHLKAADEVKHSGIIMSLSSPGSSVSGPTETTPSPPDDGLPVCEEELRDDTKSLVYERKEEL